MELSARLRPLAGLTLLFVLSVGGLGRSQEALERGEALFRQRKCVEAMAAFTEVLATDPSNAQALLRRGVCRLIRDNALGARADLDLSVELRPQVAEAWYGRALALQKLRDYRGALADLDRAAARGMAKDASFLCNRGLCKVRLADLDGALADFTEAIREDPRFALGYQNRAGVLTKMGRLQEARADYEKLRQLDPRSEVAARHLAEIDRQGGAPAAPSAGTSAAARSSAPAREPKPPAPPSTTSAAPATTQGAGTTAPVPAQPLVAELIRPDALAGGRSGGDVLATKALMRLLVGPVSAAQQPAFDAPYAAAYSHPTARVAARYRSLNQRLVDALVQRELMLRSLREYDAAKREAQVAELLGDLEGQRDAMAIAALQNQTIQAAATRLQAIAEKAEAEEKNASAEAEEPLALDGSRAFKASLRTVLAARPAASPAARPGHIGKWTLDRTVKTEDKRYWDPTDYPRHESVIEDASAHTTYTRLYHGEAGRRRSEEEVHESFSYSWDKPPQQVLVYPPRQGPPLDPFAKVTLRYKVEDAGTTFVPPDYRDMPYAPHPAAALGVTVTWAEIAGDGSVAGLVGAAGSYAGGNDSASVRLEKDPAQGTSAEGSYWTFLSPPEVDPAKPPAPALVLRVSFGWGHVDYVYRWVPGSSPLATEAAAEDLDESLDEEARAAISEHLANIRYAQKAIDGYRRELITARDAAAADRIRFNIVHLEQDAHDSKDLIESVKTGRLVHTRGPWEQHAEAVAVQNSLRIAEQVDRAHQMQASALRMAAVLRQYAPEEARKAHELILSQISTGIFEKDGMARAQKALDQIHGLTRSACLAAQGEREQGQAASAAIAEGTARSLDYVESLKRNADRAVFVGTLLTPMGAGAAISIAYEGATVGIEKGPVAAIQQVAWDAVTMAAQAGAMKAGEVVLGRFVNPRTAAATEDVFAAAKYRQELEWNQALVGRVKETQRALADARKGGAATAGLAKLEGAAAEAASAANGSALAKRVMKNELAAAEEAARVAGKQVKITAQNPGATKVTLAAEAEATRRLREVEDLHAGYQTTLNGVYQKVDDAMVDGLHGRGYKVEKGWFREFRNACSRGANADRDLGLIREYETRLLRTSAGGSTVPVLSLEGFMADAQKEYDAAFRKANNGRSARLADQNITTTAHGEAFPVDFLDEKTVATATRGSCERAGQAIYTKVENALAGGDPEFVNLQKAYASLSKDLRTKILPNLDTARPRGVLTGGGIASAREYWSGIGQVMDDFAKGRIDPIDATQRMRLLTGGATMQQVASKARALMAQVGR